MIAFNSMVVSTASVDSAFAGVTLHVELAGPSAHRRAALDQQPHCAGNAGESTPDAGAAELLP
jgi:hypothetical protein